jgi:hypothetical protein
MWALEAVLRPATVAVTLRATQSPCVFARLLDAGLPSRGVSAVPRQWVCGHRQVHHEQSKLVAFAQRVDGALGAIDIQVAVAHPDRLPQQCHRTDFL